MNRMLSSSFLVTVALATMAYAATPTAVHTFACNGSLTSCPQGGSPEIVIQGSDGNLYGATQVSSYDTSQPNGGTIFSITPTGKFTLLHTFTAGKGNNYAQGSLPAALLEGPDGNLYGTTFYGGTAGFGVVYRISRQGAGFQVIHQFGSTPTDGLPAANLVLGQDGNLYGSTTFGGTNNFCYAGCGTLYRVTPSSGDYEVVLNFDGHTNGSSPSNLMVASDGTLVGLSGGLFHYTPSNGTFKLDSFSLPPVRGLPAVPFDLTMGPNGKLYGLYSGYSLGGAGLFQVDLDGSNVHEFPQYRTTRNSGDPLKLLLASDGNFWVPEYNGSNGLGDLIVLSPSTGKVLKTISFTSSTGTNPGGLIQVTNGSFVGTTAYGGSVPNTEFGGGVVYKLNAGLPAP